MSNSIWVLDPAHSNITFKVKHLMISNVKGNFNQFEVAVDGENFDNAKISVNIGVDSINTNNADRDGHLKSPDFFDVTNFPAITFQSQSMTKIDDENYNLNGNLTIKGVTKAIELKAEFGGISKDPWGNEKAAFEISGVISRELFGLTYNAALETGGVLIGNDVKLNAEVQFVKQAV
jgi:polyisoprenoid-binding protein YceI